VGNVDVPSYNKLAWPVLESVDDLGGSASIGEIVEAVIKREDFTDEQQALMHGGGPQTELAYRLGWARTALRATGFLTNSSRGIWSLSDTATALLNDPSLTIEQRGERVDGLIAEYRTGLRPARKGGGAEESAGAVYEPDDDGPETPSQEADWKQQLLEHLLAMKPDAFERLASRLLREAGIDNVVTGKTGDGGIDGRGIFRVGLVSFPVVFQCKRYQGSVGSSTVRDFRGAMSGRTDKGLIITTGTFTAGAKKEATREGVPPIDLIDGDALCDELKKYGLGAQTQQVETVTVIGSFFSDI
jgi:restriction system protein